MNLETFPSCFLCFLSVFFALVDLACFAFFPSSLATGNQNQDPPSQTPPSSCTLKISGMSGLAAFQFGHVFIKQPLIFYSTELSVAFVNLKPITPGHVLVSSKRLVPRFTELTPEEVSDLFNCVQKVGKVVEKVYQGSSLTIAIQDGPEAGQSVKHVHSHVIPRKVSDYANNDDIYKDLDETRIENKERRDRTYEEMATEAEMLRNHF